MENVNNLELKNENTSTKTYLLVYVYVNKGTHGVGHIDVSVENYDLNACANIMDTEKELEEKYNYEKVIIVNIILLND